MRRFVFLFVPLICLGCEEQELIRVPCPPGDVRECSWDPESTRMPVGECKYGTQTCSSSGWSECVGSRGPAEEICDGLDNDCDLYIDETYPEENQLCGFIEGADYGVGVCVPGVFVCEDAAPRCEGHVGPSEELCDGLDNDCDGTIDEGVANSTAIVCYDGPAGTMAIGECRAGVRYCQDGGFDGPCDGEVLPVPEICDDKDNDCDGEVDEGFDNRGVDIVFIIDISGSFDDEIQSMIEGIAPLLDDPITSNFRFGLSIIGSQNTGGGTPLLTRYSKLITDFVPADEFLEYLEGIQLLPGGGIEPSVDVPKWIMNGDYYYSWAPSSQKVIIIMTDEQAQTVTATPITDVNQMAIDGGFEIFVFALPEHHNIFIRLVRGEQDRLYSPSVNSATVFQQIKQIFNDLCVGGE